MGFQLKQGLRLSQSLRMTPQLQQAIKLLQLSRTELETAIQKELDENPVLEELAEEDPRNTQERKSEEAANEPVNIVDQDPQKQDEFDWENYIESTYKPTPSSGGPANDEVMNYENIISATENLYDYLNWQVNLAGFNDEEKQLASILVNYIDEDGYLKTPIEEIAREENVDPKELEEMIPFIQEFDPPGIGARDLKECLLLQAKAIDEDTHELVFLINNHLKELEKRNYEGIAKAMNKPLEEIVSLCKIIYDMEPKPGRAYMPPETQYVTPDVYVYKVGEEYVVSLNEEGLPRLRVSNLYKNILRGGSQQQDKKLTQDYIQEKLKSAVWLIKAIHQRQRTIYKVTESIVRYQKDFFEKGPAFIRPMILRDIANDIGMHESTVSRVTSNKYVHTPRGIFELKYFFNSGISKSDGDSLASESVKLKIKDLVDKEDPKSPLSDQKLVELLLKDGIEIARRTVAKYRDVLGILPSSRRKKYF